MKEIYVPVSLKGEYRTRVKDLIYTQEEEREQVKYISIAEESKLYQNACNKTCGQFALRSH
jgi:hypothetical protein